MDKITEQKINKELGQVSPFSQIVQNALNLIDCGSSDNRELAKILNKDPILTARLLALANSSFYGMSRQVNNVESAFVILGNNLIKNILISAAALQSFPATENRKKIWIHSIEVATVSQFLAGKLKQSKEKAYLAGLLHDIGKFILLNSLPEQQSVIESGTSIAGEKTIEDETVNFGLNHAEIGANIISVWKLPEDIVSIVKKHHSPLEADDPIACGIVNLANVICHKLGKNLSDEDFLDSLNVEIISLLNINKEDIKNMLPDIKQEISSLDDFFEKIS